MNLWSIKAFDYGNVFARESGVDDDIPVVSAMAGFSRIMQALEDGAEKGTLTIRTGIYMDEHVYSGREFPFWVSASTEPVDAMEATERMQSKKGMMLLLQHSKIATSPFDRHRVFAHLRDVMQITLSVVNKDPEDYPEIPASQSVTWTMIPVNIDKKSLSQRDRRALIRLDPSRREASVAWRAGINHARRDVTPNTLAMLVEQHGGVSSHFIDACL